MRRNSRGLLLTRINPSLRAWPRNHLVIGADRLAGPLEFRSKLTIMRRRLLGEREHVEPCRELLDHQEIFHRPCRFLSTINHFSERDGRNAELIREAVEALAQSCRSVLDDIDADIRVEHVTQHQRRSRSSTIGCLRSAMKSSETRGPSKNESQDWSAGLIIRLRPILVISTWRTPAGKATGLGRRTA